MKPLIPAALAILVAGFAPASADLAVVNDSFELARTPDGSVTLVERGGRGAVFTGEFHLLRATEDPKMASRPLDTVDVSYNVVTWRAASEAEGGMGRAPRGTEAVGDGFDASILKGDTEGRTPDLYRAARVTTLRPASAEPTERGIRWLYPDTNLQASVTLPAGSGYPVLEWSFTADEPGWYSVGYAGAQASALADVQDAWQPMIWQEKRFPDRCYLTLAYRCPLPTTLVTRDGATVGVVADPSEYPFDPLPLMDNSRFGVALRNAAGEAQPLLFAPALGGLESRMEAGGTRTFRARLVVEPGDTTDAFAAVAKELYGFHDYRRGDLCSVNETLDNIVAYGMSHWSRFLEADKGCSYATDAPGTVKNVSSLNPLSMAMVRDDEEIFKRRAYPYVEYMLSRKKFLFTVDETQKIQSPSYTLEGPCAPVSELASLHRIFSGASPVFLRLALDEQQRGRVRNLDDLDPGDTWQNALWLYRATGEKAWLDRARAGADRYIAARIDTPQSSFRSEYSGKPFFWTTFAPRFAELYELYSETGEARHLEAARKAARRFAQFTWMSPAIPGGVIRVNKGGKAPHYWYLKSKGHTQMECPEEDAPAWRLSAIGLTPESSGTCTGHRAIFMANYAPWLLRIGAASGDDFLVDIARSAIVGRYRNFPGYHINTARTTVYEKADYPLRPHEELSVNSFHYNHVWPMASMLLDYLAAEAWARSQGAIDFPSDYIEGYAYLQNRFYGGGAGRFYGFDDAVLWMPAGLLQAESADLNYIAARGDGRLYLALMNAGPDPLRTKVRLDQGALPSLGGRSLPARISRDGGAAEAAMVVDGALEVEVSPKGLTAVVLEGIEATPRFQQKVMGMDASGAWRRDFIRFEDPRGRAMILNLGPGARTAYVFLEDGKRDFNSVTLHSSTGEGWNAATDREFPWEFTISLDASVSEFRFWLECNPAGGKPTATGEMSLSQGGAAAEPSYALAGRWNASTLAGHEPGKRTFWTTTPGAAASWKPAFDGPRTARVWIHRIVHRENNDPAMRVTIIHGTQAEEKTVDCTEGATGWIDLGEYEFSGGPLEGVSVERASTEGMTRASAARFETADGKVLVLDEPTAGAPSP